MIVQRLRIRADGASLGVEDAHGVGNDVEDRLELRDAAREVVTQLFALGDVVAGEEKSALVARCRAGRCDRREHHVDHPLGAGARAEGDANRFGAHAAHDTIDHVVEVGQRVRERVVDGPAERADGVGAGEIAVALVRAEEAELFVEERDCQGNVLEHRVEPRQLRAQPMVITRWQSFVERVSHTSHASMRSGVAPRGLTGGGRVADNDAGRNPGGFGRN